MGNNADGDNHDTDVSAPALWGSLPLLFHIISSTVAQLSCTSNAMCKTEGWQLVKLNGFFPTPTGEVATITDATSAAPLAPPVTLQPCLGHPSGNDYGDW